MNISTNSESLVRKEDGKASKSKNCAECRRLKIKCDRQIPCSNCQKRGTASICPDGQLVARRHRLILTSTEDLHARIEQLMSRVQELEEALAILQAAHSDELHPLLRESTEPPTTALGSLMINDNGTSEFYGPTSSFWTTIPGDKVDEDAKFISPQPLPIPSMFTQHPVKPVADTSLPNLDFPLPTEVAPHEVPRLRHAISSGLPPKAEALALVERFYQGASWQICPVPRMEFITEIFSPCYAGEGPVTSIQGLAVFYATLSLGMLRVEAPNYAAEAHKFITLSRACLTLDSVISNTSITAINAMLLHVAYLVTALVPHGYSRAEATLGMIVRLAQSIGLHREPSLWGITEELANKRRKTMWELINIHLWMSLMSGRPSLLARACCDVQIPIEPKDGMELGLNFNIGKYYYAEACLWPVLELALATKQTTYQAILKLDTKIREWGLPKELEPYSLGDQILTSNFGETIRRIFREITILCLHRSYFARALLEKSDSMASSRYSRSILAVYNSACTILERVLTLYEQEPVLIMRFTFFWTHCFSAAVILSAIVIREPESSFTDMALRELDKAANLFKRATDGSRAVRGSPTVIRLRDKAYAAVHAYRSGNRSEFSLDSPIMEGLGVGSSTQQAIRQHQQGASSGSSMNMSREQLPRIGQNAGTDAFASFEVPFAPPSLGEPHAIWDGMNVAPLGQVGVQADEGYLQTLDSTENLHPGHPHYPLPGGESPTHNIYHLLPPEFDPFVPGELGDLAQGLSGSSFQFHPSSDYVMQHVEDPEAAVLWENFLREAGIGA